MNSKIFNFNYALFQFVLLFLTLICMKTISCCSHIAFFFFVLVISVSALAIGFRMYYVPVDDEETPKRPMKDVNLSSKQFAILTSVFFFMAIYASLYKYANPYTFF